MSDPNTPHDPIDKAYAEAEATLRDDAERAARRARVLAAVARDAEPDVAAKPVVASLPPPRKGAWRPAPWLMAAGVVGVTVLVTMRMTPPAVVRPPELPAQEAAPAEAPAGAASQDAASTPPPPAIAKPAPPPGPAARARAQAAADMAPPVVTRAEPEPFPAAAAPPPMPAPRAEEHIERPAPAPPPPPPPAAPMQRSLEQAASRAVGGAVARESRAASNSATEVVVTGSSIRGVAPVTPNDAARLRAAATDGRIDDLTVLLGLGVAVDAPDAAGDTALMKAVQAGQIAAINLLRRNGAEVDRRNRAGVSAKEMAAASANPGVRRAMGIAP